MANIQDVAKLADVSISTVSRVLNGSAHVNPEVAARVRAAIETLHYQPSHAARTLQTNRSRIIGLLITDIQNPFFTTLIRSVEDIAQQNGYSVILCNSDEDPLKERQYIEVLCAERVAGAIIVSTNGCPRDIKRFDEHNIPIVAVDRRIGIITGPQALTTGRERLEGYRRALCDAGIESDTVLERYGSFKAESGYQLAYELLNLVPPIDALFVGNNLMTLGALEAIYVHGLHVPEDIALVGFDEMSWAAISAISLTTVTQPIYEIGSIAASRLFRRLYNPDAFTRQEIVLAPALQIRGSSQPRSLPVY